MVLLPSTQGKTKLRQLVVSLDTNGGLHISHTLEHSNYGEQMISKTVAEWYRVLRPGGILLISVPDLSVLARMYLDPSFNAQDRWIVTQMMYGGQADEGDYHHVSHMTVVFVLLFECVLVWIGWFQRRNSSFNPPTSKLLQYHSSEFIQPRLL